MPIQSQGLHDPDYRFIFQAFTRNRNFICKKVNFKKWGYLVSIL